MTQSILNHAGVLNNDTETKKSLRVKLVVDPPTDNPTRSIKDYEDEKKMMERSIKVSEDAFKVAQHQSEMLEKSHRTNQAYLLVAVIAAVAAWVAALDLF